MKHLDASYTFISTSGCFKILMKRNKLREKDNELDRD